MCLLAFRAELLLAALCTAAWAAADTKAAPDAKAAPAEDPERVAAEKLFRDIYGDNYDRVSKSKDVAERSKFAKALADAAKLASDNAKLAGVLREKALEFAGGDFAGHMLARELILAIPPQSPGRLQALERVTDVVEKALPSQPVAKRADPATALVTLLRELADEQAAQGKVPAAIRTLIRAKSAVRTHLKAAKQTLSEIERREEEIGKRAAEASAYETAVKTLAEKPDDVRANIAVAAHWIVSQGKPAEALPFLRKTGIAAFLKLADALAKEDPNHTEIGDAYRAAAPLVPDAVGRKGFLGRAAGHYQAAVRIEPKHPDAVRLKLIITQITAETPAVAIAANSKVGGALEFSGPEKQVKDVIGELIRLNPGYNGKFEHKIENGEVTELAVDTQNIADITPLKALTGLKRLYLRAAGNKPGKVSDLAPLKGLQLNLLQCCDNKITDLSPLAEMPLRSFSCTFDAQRDAKLLTNSHPITQWMVAGPFPDSVKELFPIPAGGVLPKAEFAKTYPIIGGAGVTWKSMQSDAAGIVSLPQQPNSSVLAYALFESPTEQEIRILSGSDDSIVIWVNGEKVHEYRTDYRAAPANPCDRTIVPVKKGINHILVRCDNYSGTWEFAVRVPKDIKPAAPN